MSIRQQEDLLQVHIYLFGSLFLGTIIAIVMGALVVIGVAATLIAVACVNRRKSAAAQVIEFIITSK